MYAELYEFLILHRQLPIPGIGTLQLETHPSVTDLSYRQINAPAFSLTLNRTAAQPTKRLFQWLAHRLGIGYNEAVMQFNNFSFDLRSKVMSGQKVVWSKVGTLSKTVNEEVRFEPGMQELSLDPAVSATKIIRDKAEHRIRVGEEEKTSVEMAEWLNESTSSLSRWWLPALIAGIILVFILVVHFSQRGVSGGALGNQQGVTVKKAGPGYQKLP